MRERGLKQLKIVIYLQQALSLPMRERGLKHHHLHHLWCPSPVAPHAGAWIETSVFAGLTDANKSLPMRERGLKRKV